MSFATTAGHPIKMESEAERRIRELAGKVQILVNKVSELEHRMNQCKCGCCKKE